MNPPPDFPNNPLSPAVVAGARLRLARVDDCEALAGLAQSAHSHPWSERQYRDSMASGHRVWLLEHEAGEPIACCVVSQLLDEAEILDIAVAPAWRRRGIARALLGQVIQRLVGQTARLLLEVRVSNTPARSLYSALGFVEDGVRRGYYPTAVGGREDAVLMSLDLHQMPQPPA
ncbi:ribosomal protein S18-alanine N-acetyltransferase [Microbulbifer yueqingensis]|uniref:[Ribosomal protein bS18]-alanine N-acetyltransferase n=1 Tax=Microbulbifer yueqingensis TaxID=658219 RepID=A0A1G8W067_9GAMM|nr:ribosomal protein S18-alanine N-acetyltransferase [Microbulbifer yueqingensis]SDJ71712.1 [SSU ribosomal protein S18P]-alanine acetyltransferase [Microbulbifer yueqingensis]